MADSATRAKFDHMCTSMAKALIYKLGNLSIDAKSAMMLYDAIKETSFSGDIKGQLTEVVDAAIVQWQPAETDVAKIVYQRMDYSSNYLTAGDWDGLFAANGLSDCILIVCRRMRACNVKLMSESLVKQLTAILTSLQIDKLGKMPEYHQIYKCSFDIRSCFQALPSDVPIGVPSPAAYPEKPDSLGEKFLNYAYKAEDPPVCKALPRLHDLMKNHTPVRNTSKLLQSNEQKASGCLYNPTAEATLQPALQHLASIADSLKSTWDKASANLQKPPAEPLAAPPAGSTASLPPAPLSAPAEDRAITAGPSPEAAIPEPPGLKEPAMPRLRLSLLGARPAVPSTTPTATIDEFEQMAFDKVTKRRLAGKQKAPTDGDTSAGLGKRQKANGSAKALILGCCRCRGSEAGCSACRKPTFSGLRFGSHKAWQTWYDNKKTKSQSSAAKKVKNAAKK